MTEETTDYWDEWDFSIRIAGNTGPRALMTLWQKGYRIKHWTIEVSDNNYVYEYLAKKGSRLFSATTPEELLGLVAIWETRGDKWRETTDEEWKAYDTLMDESPLYDDDGNEIIDEDDVTDDD